MITGPGFCGGAALAGAGGGAAGAPGAAGARIPGLLTCPPAAIASAPNLRVETIG